MSTGPLLMPSLSDDQNYDPRSAGGFGERRYVRSEDRDLLEGADAEAMSIKAGHESVAKQNTLSPLPITPGGSRDRSPSASTQKEALFER